MGFHGMKSYTVILCNLVSLGVLDMLKCTQIPEKLSQKTQDIDDFCFVLLFRHHSAAMTWRP